MNQILLTENYSDKEKDKKVKIKSSGSISTDTKKNY